jgi:hypothetical protein
VGGREVVGHVIAKNNIKRVVKRGTNRFASASYTIADVFRYLIRAIVSCFKFEEPITVV